MNARVEFSWGTTEIKARICDAIVDLTETGSSIRANNLRVIDTLLTSTIRFVANREAWEIDWKREKMENIAMLLTGAIAARGKVGLKLNVNGDRLSEVVEALPALKSPTVNETHDGGYAVEVIIDEQPRARHHPQAQADGGDGDLQLPAEQGDPVEFGHAFALPRNGPVPGAFGRVVGLPHGLRHPAQAAARPQTAELVPCAGRDRPLHPRADGRGAADGGSRRTSRSSSALTAPAAPAGGVAVASAVEPATRLEWPTMLPEELHRFIEVRTKNGREVVTVIELLSPTNKADGLTQFQAKRHGLHAAGVHFLQIDLLRGGGPRLLPQAVPPHDYNAMLLRGGDTAADVWMWTLRDPLPVLPVPLAGDDPDVTLDLRAALDVTYEANEYARFIYNEATPADLDPPLIGDDLVWATQRLPARAAQVGFQ